MNAEAGNIQAQTPGALAYPGGIGVDPLVALARRLGDLRAALSQLVEVADETSGIKITRLQETLQAFEPAITLIGQVKSGKTTLVNAMAGLPDLLPADVNPWTSVVTSLHLSPEGAELGRGARFRFFEADEWDRLLSKGGRIGELASRAGAHEELDRIRDQIEAMRRKSRDRLGRKFELLLGQTHEYEGYDRELIERYICLGDAVDGQAGSALASGQGRFADITRSADLYLRQDGLPLPICLRDTPGVNDTFMMREQITVRAIRDSRICVVVLSAHQALTSVDMALIRLISNVRAREVVIFVNRIDELSDPSAQVPEIEQSIRQTLKDQHAPAEIEIIFGSALWGVHALRGALSELPADSAQALLNWAKGRLPEARRSGSPAETVWRLSGVPDLFAALSHRIAEGAGRDLVDKVSRSALNFANGLNKSASGPGEPRPVSARIDRSALEDEIVALATRQFRSLDAALEELVESYHKRIDRAHESFVERATESLLSHLERNGDGVVWEYSPTGLRMLLRSAYTVFGTATQHALQRVMEAAARDLGDLYARAFGAAPDDFAPHLPAAPRVPPPVFLGQTIVLDVKGRWWSNWWRRWRGYKALAQNFHDLIRAETAPMVAELKEAQAEELCRAATGVLDEFLDEQRAILIGIMEGGETGSTAGVIPGDDDGAMRRRMLKDTLATLTRCAA